VKVFIAGHTGLVGSSLIREAPEGVKIVTATRSEVDFSNTNTVATFLARSRPDAIIVAAAKVGGIAANSKFQSSFLLENLEIQNNIIGQAALLGISNLLFLGSSCIYPKDARQPISENALLTGPLESTNEGYAIAKIAGIRLAKAIHDETGKNYFSLMPTNLYGPHDNYDKFSSHVPAALLRRFHEAKIEKKPTVTIWGSGKPKREFMHVNDLAVACWMFLSENMGGQLINIGTGVDISIKDFSLLIAQIVDFKGEIEFDMSKPDGVSRKLLDVTLAKSLGWSARISLEDGLASTYSWFVNAWERGEIRGL
jgi:GDP-L-fucose synthase